MGSYADRYRGLVSLWVAREVHDNSVDILKELCGVDHYDVDFQEIAGENDQSKSAPLESLLRELSYYPSFLQAALAAARQAGIDSALWVVAQYDYAYERARISKAVSPDPMFLGVFRYTVPDDGSA